MKLRAKQIAGVLVLLALGAVLMGAPPVVGRQAPDFTLPKLQGGRLTLSQITAAQPVVLIVLRGYPGYQCPYCNRQAHDFLSSAAVFQRAGVRVMLVYPGAARDLEKRAQEFAADKPLPDGFDLLLDPDYAFTEAYGLRWNQAGETAYPSTFLIDKQRNVVFAKIGQSHEDRAKAADILEFLKKRGN